MAEQGMSTQLGDLQLMALGDLQALAFILAGALAGGFVNGLTGFGTALTGLPLWLQAVEPPLAAQLASACSVLGHARPSRVWKCRGRGAASRPCWSPGSSASRSAPGCCP